MELLKSFILIISFLLALSISIWGAITFEVLWLLFIVIPILVIIFKIIIVSSTVAIKCQSCKKELGVKTGGLASLWLAEKPKQCQWCGHENV